MQAQLISVVWALTFALPYIQSDELYCGEPPVIQFATLNERALEQYAVGTTITYECQFGYTTRGKSSTLECKKNSEHFAEWTEPRFSCTPQSCGDPGYISNGRRVGFLFAFPHSVKYECNDGYRLKGLSTRYCQASGLWSGKLPVCEEIACPPPRDLENGFVTFDTLDYGSELKYKCDKGFHLNTNEAVFCTSDGRWSNSDVQCIESICHMPENPEYGSVQISSSDGKLLAGSLALFSCNGGRIADGPTTSKCLETGEWIFPPPKCLEPCNIPYLTNGIVGNYDQDIYSRRRNFKQITVGSKVKDDEISYLRCADGYEVLDSEKKEVTVSCKLGKWSTELHCEPASCRNQPPSVQNAQAVALNPEHGGKVLYLCDEDFKKVVNETIVCDFGTWKGTRPTCKDTRCSVDALNFPGLVKGGKTYYRLGEVFDIQCDSRYRVANANQGGLRCEEGTWKGLLPPCVAASCIRPPPTIDHGEPAVHSTFHSSIVRYTCEDPYILTKNYQVQCLFGEWKGQLPKCEDSRCYVENLKNSENVNLVATDSVTLSANKLNVICKEGYSPTPEQPICMNGKWSGIPESPCKESDCTIPMLYHGDIKELKMGDYYWHWRSFKYVRQANYVKIPAGTSLPYGSTLILFCNSGYSFQGTSVKSQGIICSKGKWLPEPVCLIVGQRYIPQTTQKPSTTTLPTIPEKSKTVRTTTKVSRISVADEFLEEVYETVTPPAERIQTSKEETFEVECECEYPINDDNLIAHVDGEKLNFHDKVKNGSVVVFRCKHVGFHRLHGPQNIICEGCQTWHSSEFPTCSEQTSGSAVIIFDNTLNVSVEGNLEARKGQDIKLMCVAVESAVYPQWNVPSENRVSVKRERMERDSYGDVLYITHLSIENADFENEGLYGCSVENNTMNIIKIVINDPNLLCPEFPEIDGVGIIYDMARHIQSQAIFSCTKPNQEIHGKSALTCKNNGEWSDTYPQCTDIKCKELKDNDLLRISYTNDRKIGSRATFHCFVPGIRSGASFAECLKNRTWSHPTPFCRTPPCSVDNIFSALPMNVIPNMDGINKTVPYNTTIKLTCAEDMIAKGDGIAKCNRNGEWIVENIQCISGCPELKKDPESSLIITPHKDVYKLGDMVAFSCPPGMSLTTQSQLIMCLKYGWSETILPDCQ